MPRIRRGCGHHGIWKAPPHFGAQPNGVRQQLKHNEAIARPVTVPAQGRKAQGMGCVRGRSKRLSSARLACWASFQPWQGPCAASLKFFGIRRLCTQGLALAPSGFSNGEVIFSSNQPYLGCSSTRDTKEPSSCRRFAKSCTVSMVGLTSRQDFWICIQGQVGVPKGQSVTDQHQVNVAADRVLFFGDGAVHKSRLDLRCQRRKRLAQWLCQTDSLARMPQARPKMARPGWLDSASDCHSRSVPKPLCVSRANSRCTAPEPAPASP